MNVLMHQHQRGCRDVVESEGSGAICWPPYLASRLVSRGRVMAGFPGLDELFEGRHFDREIIVLCVRWYLRFKLSFRDLVEMVLVQMN